MRDEIPDVVFAYTGDGREHAATRDARTTLCGLGIQVLSSRTWSTPGMAQCVACVDAAAEIRHDGG